MEKIKVSRQSNSKGMHNTMEAVRIRKTGRKTRIDTHSLAALPLYWLLFPPLATDSGKESKAVYLSVA